MLIKKERNEDDVKISWSWWLRVKGAKKCYLKRKILKHMNKVIEIWETRIPSNISCSVEKYCFKVEVWNNRRIMHSKCINNLAVKKVGWNSVGLVFSGPFCFVSLLKHIPAALGICQILLQLRLCLHSCLQDFHQFYLLFSMVFTVGIPVYLICFAHDFLLCLGPFL